MVAALGDPELPPADPAGGPLADEDWLFQIEYPAAASTSVRQSEAETAGAAATATAGPDGKHNLPAELQQLCSTSEFLHFKELSMVDFLHRRETKPSMIFWGSRN